MIENGRPILLIGGGNAGITAAVEAAEAGCEVVRVERAPWLGGRVARMSQYFPKLCPPACGLEINFKRTKNNPRIHVLTMTEVEELAGEPGDYRATLKIVPRYVTAARTLCGAYAEVCPAERPDEFNYRLSNRTAAAAAASAWAPAPSASSSSSRTTRWT